METLTQNYKRRKTKFVFEDDFVSFTYQTRNSDQTINVPYGSITNRQSKFMEENESLRNVGLLWLAIGFIFEIMPMLSSQTFHLPMWFTIGVACLVYAHTTKTRYTSLDSGNYNLLVMHDGEQDSIIATIYEKKKEYLRKNLFNVDKNSSFEIELNKLNFLLEEQVISQQEFDEMKKVANTVFETDKQVGF